MNFAVGNVGKVENLAKKLKKIAIFFEKPIAYFSFFLYNIVKVVKSGAKCSKVVDPKGLHFADLSPLSPPIKSLDGTTRRGFLTQNLRKGVNPDAVWRSQT